MAQTYEPIATATLTGSSATFTSIPSTYTDLRLVFAGTADANTQVGLRYNNISTSVYSSTCINANGSAVTTLEQPNENKAWINLLSTYSTTQPFFFTADIFSYAGSTNKTTLTTFSQDRNGSGFTEQSVGLWRNTSAINRVDILPSAGGLTGTATLYGILKA